MTFSQRISFDHLLLVYHQDECGFGDEAYLAGAYGDMLESLPALGQRREASFTEGWRCAWQGIAGPCTDVQFLDSGWLLDRGMDAAACAFVAGIGQDRQAGQKRQA